MALIYVCLFLQLLCCFHQAWAASPCTELNELTQTVQFTGISDACWLIPFEEDYVVKLDITQVTMDLDCDRFYVAVTTAVNETQKFCDGDKATIRAYGNLEIQLIHENIDNNASESFIIFSYQKERSVFLLEGVNKTREYLISKLYAQGKTYSGWGDDIHRITTALFLAGGVRYVDKKEMRTQLDLHASLSLLRNSTHPLTVNKLSLLVNALTATCQKPQQFYDQNLLQVLEDRATSSLVPNPNAILSICDAGGKLEKPVVDKMFFGLMQNLSNSFNIDHRAMSLMALECLKKKSNNFEYNPFASIFHKQSAKSLIEEQRSDGSFGNVYTTALVTQALIGTGQINNRDWKLFSTFRFLMQHANSSDTDFQMMSLILPALNNKSLVDLAETDCTNRSKINRDELGNGTIQVFYSLFIGEEKKVIKTVNVLVPVNSTALDVMKKAQTDDSTFNFNSMPMGDSLNIYKINGIANDFQVGKIWLLYTMPSFPNGTLTRQNKSADKLTMHHWEHLIMWYKTIHM